MKLYFSKGACSLVPRIIINEIGLSCDFESVDLATKKTESGLNFYSINPKGSVPTLETDDKQVVTENAVILQYLADTAKAEQLLPLVGNFKRYRILEWLNFVTTELHKGFSPLFSPKLPQEIKTDIIIPLLKQKFSFVNQHLEKNKYFMGEEFTLPDAYLFVILLWAEKFKFDLNEWPHLARFFAELKARKSVQQSLEQEGLK